MKKWRLVVGSMLLLVGNFSCSHDLYPLGRAAKNAYKDNLKTMRADYMHFTPVVLPVDSLAAAQWTAPSPNFDIRSPNMVIIHHTAQQSCQQSLRTLTNAAAKGRVSAHYLVCKDGTVYRLVDERYRAWQAGVSRWGNMRNINSLSIGIELDNNGFEHFSQPQIHSLLVLLESLKRRYHIPTGNFVGHADVAPTRKQDPNVYFPWGELARHGYGYGLDSLLPEPPPHFDAIAALRLIGYDVRDTTAAIVAFKRHYVQTDISPALRPIDKRALYDIYGKYLHYAP